MGQIKALAMSIEEAVYEAFELGITEFSEICVYVRDVVGYVDRPSVHRIVEMYYWEE